MFSIKHFFLHLYAYSTKVKDKCSNPFLSVLKNSCCTTILNRINYVILHVFKVHSVWRRGGFHYLLDYFWWHVSDRCYWQNVTCYSIHLSVNSVLNEGIITNCFLVSLFNINILTVATYFIISQKYNTM